MKPLSNEDIVMLEALGEGQAKQLEIVAISIQMFRRLMASARREQKLREEMKDISDNHDHDADAHKYGTRCYVCVAENALAFTGEPEGKK